MAAPLDLPSALSFFICSINSLAAFRTPGTGRSSALSIRSTAMKQAAGAGVSTSRMLSGQAITAASCTFSPASGKLAISSGFFCTAGSHLLLQGRILNFQDHVWIVQDPLGQDPVRGPGVFIQHNMVCLGLYIYDFGGKIRRFVAIILRHAFFLRKEAFLSLEQFSVIG